MLKRFIFLTAAIKVAVLAYWLPKMGWGTIDDAYHWELAHRSEGVMALFKHLVSLDLTAGMFRPVYNFYMMFGYGVFESHPQAFYALCWVLVVAPAVAMAWFCLSLALRRKPSANAAIALTAMLFAYDPWTRLFTNLSLQEKLGMAWLPAVVFFSLRGWTAAALAASVLMLLSKATMISYGPPLLALLWLMRPSGWKASLGVQGALFAAAAVFFSGIRKGYTASYSLSLDRYLINLPLADASTWVIWLVSLGVLIGLRRRSRVALIGAIGVLSASVVMVPWASADYYMSILAPWILALAAGLCALLPEKRRTGVLAAASLLGLGGLFIHLWPAVHYNHQMTKVVRLLGGIRRDGSHGRAYLAACNETRDSLNLFSMPDYADSWDAADPRYFVRTLTYLTPGPAQLWIESSRCRGKMPRSVQAGRRLFESADWAVTEVNVAKE